MSLAAIKDKGWEKVFSQLVGQDSTLVREHGFHNRVELVGE